MGPRGSNGTEFHKDARPSPCVNTGTRDSEWFLRYVGLGFPAKPKGLQGSPGGKECEVATHVCLWSGSRDR